MPTFVTVRGDYGRPQALAGDYYAAQGSVTFLISSVVKDAAGDVVFDRVPVRAVLDSEGRFTVDLLATDDPALQPEGLTYTVTEKIRGAEQRAAWSMEVPLAAAGVGIDMADVVPATPGPQVFTYALASEVADLATQIADLQISGGGLTTEQVQDIVGAQIVAGTNVTVTYDDAAGTVTIAASGGGGGLTEEQAQDIVGAMATDSSVLDFTYDDAAGTIVATIKPGSVTAAMVAADVATQAELDAVAAAKADSGHAHNGLYDPAGSAAAAQAVAIAASQPLDSDLTAIAALSTTNYGRSLLALADAAALRSTAGLGTAATASTGDFQPVDSDLTAIAALATTSFGRSFLSLADAAAGRTLLGLGALAVKSAIAVPGDITATGTASATTYLRGDGTWQTPAGGGTTGATGLPGPPSNVEGPARVGGTAAFSQSGSRGVAMRLLSGHGQTINSLLLQCVATSADTQSYGYARQLAAGPLTGDTDLQILYSTGSIPSPAVGLVTISLGSTITVDVSRDWVTGSASGTGTTYRSVGTSSTVTNSFQAKYGSEVINFRHPFATSEYINNSTGTGVSFGRPVVVGVTV